MGLPADPLLAVIFINAIIKRKLQNHNLDFSSLLDAYSMLLNHFIKETKSSVRRLTKSTSALKRKEKRREKTPRVRNSQYII
jgi:hypothetical protein